MGIVDHRQIPSVLLLSRILWACRYTQRPGRSARATKAVYFQ